jgi:hypothetical protein
MTSTRSLFIHLLKLTSSTVLYLYSTTLPISGRPRGTVVRAEPERFDNPCVVGSNHTMGRWHQFFFWMRPYKLRSHVAIVVACKRILPAKSHKCYA